MDGTPIPVIEENKFLGVVFDRKLSFIPHIKQLKLKCQKALNLLRVVAHTDWGTDRKVSLNLYRTIIRSKFDYDSIIYGSARKSYLEMLDPIHQQGLRLALGALRTSPSEILLAEANKPSLYNRRLLLFMQYALKLKWNPSNPTYEIVFEQHGVVGWCNDWLVGCFWASRPFEKYFSLYRAVSQRMGERKQK